MAIISANVQYNRGEHSLLDYSSFQKKYSDALKWAKNQYSNAAIGQYIYINEDETIENVTYAKGPYIVESIGENSILSPLLKNIAGAEDLTDNINSLKVDINNIQTNLSDVDASINLLESYISTLPSTFVIGVKDANGKSLVDESGIATLENYATIDDLNNSINGLLVKNINASDNILSLSNGIISSQLSFTKEKIDNTEYLILKGNNNVEIGKIDTREFTIDGMLETVEFSKDDGKENVLILTFNTASGKKSIEIDFSKYIDIYTAGDGILLDNNKFSIDFSKVETVESVNEFKAYVDASLKNVYTKSEVVNLLGTKVSIESGKSLVSNELITKLSLLPEITSVGNNLSISNNGQLNVDLTNYIVKDGNKVLSTNDFTDEYKSKLEKVNENAQENYIKSVEGDNINVDENGKLTLNLSDYTKRDEVNNYLATKLDKSTKINNVSFVDGSIFIDAGDITLNSSISRDNEIVYDNSLSIQSVLSDLSRRIDILDPSIGDIQGITSIIPGNGVNVSITGNTATLSIKLSEEENNALEIKNDGLYVNDMRSYWNA